MEILVDIEIHLKFYAFLEKSMKLNVLNIYLEDLLTLLFILSVWWDIVFVSHLPDSSSFFWSA